MRASDGYDGAPSAYARRAPLGNWLPKRCTASDLWKREPTLCITLPTASRRCHRAASWKNLAPRAPRGRAACTQPSGHVHLALLALLFRRGIQMKVWRDFFTWGIQAHGQETGFSFLPAKSFSVICKAPASRLWDGRIKFASIRPLLRAKMRVISACRAHRSSN